MFIVMLGAPGSGKGTQAYQLSQKYSIPHISSGDLLRGNPNLPDEAKELIRKGEILPDQMISKIVKDRLSEEDAKQGWILDGFPRTIKQADILEDVSPEPPVVIYLKVNDEEIKKRLGMRRTCKECGAVYHLIAHPPKNEGKCDICSGDLMQREDDNEEVIARRLTVYHEKTAPLVEYYKSKNRLITIDSTGGKSVNEIFDLIVASLMQLVR